MGKPIDFRRLMGRMLVLAAMVAFAATFFLNVCHLIFDCGCVSLWNGGAQFCNIQTAGPPDCPFCAQPDIAYGALYATFLVQGAAVFVPGSLSLGLRTILGFALFPLVVGGTGIVLGLQVGYWN